MNEETMIASQCLIESAFSALTPLAGSEEEPKTSVPFITKFLFRYTICKKEGQANPGTPEK